MWITPPRFGEKSMGTDRPGRSETGERGGGAGVPAPQGLKLELGDQGGHTDGTRGAPEVRDPDCHLVIGLKHGGLIAR